jgi:hypothetical protein
MKMKTLAWGMVAVISLGWSATMAQSNPPKVFAEFPGTSLKWIYAAEPVLQEKKLDLDKYTISLFEQADSVTVILKSADSEPGGRGSTGKNPGFEVEISKKDLKVLRSNYVR